MKKPGDRTFTKIDKYSKLCYLPIDDPYTYMMSKLGCSFQKLIGETYKTSGSQEKNVKQLQKVVYKKLLRKTRSKSSSKSKSG